AIDEYQLQVYPGRMLLLRTTNQSRANAVGLEYDPQFGWGDLVAGGLDIDYVSGSHKTMLVAPHVHVLADKLRHFLALAAHP
ncbi:hypothetical protein BV372_33670, partial [Nostoc sp. T09]|uniref:hypothetical protein n=1 Tax=Nostoc sp. T09 TaxID=1932621 RepID=UPI000B650DF2